MLFGLTNAPAPFQRMVNNIMREIEIEIVHNNTGN
jgi:hypothetical protein